jgi:hypothetical protein
LVVLQICAKRAPRHLTWCDLQLVGNPKKGVMEFGLKPHLKNDRCFSAHGWTSPTRRWTEPLDVVALLRLRR